MSEEKLNPINVTGAPLVGGSYLMYKDRPLVREGGTRVPNDVFVSVVETADQNKVYRQGGKKGLYEAFGYGIIWLEQALAK